MKTLCVGLLALMSTCLLSSTAAAPAPPAAALQAAITAAIEAELDEFIVPAGVYNFSDTPMIMAGARHFRLTAADPNNTIILFDGLSATGGVLVEGGHDITISGLTIAYDPAPLFQGSLYTTPWKGPANASGPFDCLAAVNTDPGFIPPDVFLKRWINNPVSEFVQGPQYFIAAKNYTQAPFAAFLAPPNMVASAFPANNSYILRVPCPQGGSLVKQS